MTDWVMQALKVDRARADHLRAQYWATYGTTLAGLMTEHGVDPGPYLTDVHDIDFSVLTPDPALADSHVDPSGRAACTCLSVASSRIMSNPRASAPAWRPIRRTGPTPFASWNS